MAELIDLATGDTQGDYDVVDCNCHHMAQLLFNRCCDDEADVDQEGDDQSDPRQKGFAGKQKQKRHHHQRQRQRRRPKDAHGGAQDSGAAGERSSQRVEEVPNLFQTTVIGGLRMVGIDVVGRTGPPSGGSGATASEDDDGEQLTTGGALGLLLGAQITGPSSSDESAF